ncbi:MAG: hypothetical protein WDM79_18100 [Terricaulis sp.]
MRTWIAAAAAFAMFGVLEAAAKDPPPAAPDYEAQVRSYLTAQATKHTDAGFTADAANPDLVRSLTLEGGAVVWPIELRRGRAYRVFAVCDNNCSDVDMDLYNAAGVLVGVDVTGTDKPYVEIVPTADGTAFARIWLATCEAEPCFIGARLYQKRL